MHVKQEVAVARPDSNTGTSESRSYRAVLGERRMDGQAGGWGEREGEGPPCGASLVSLLFREARSNFTIGCRGHQAVSGAAR